MSEAASGFLRQRIELIRQTQVVMLGAEVLV
jgi:uracil-DNA glycosylase